MMAGGPQADGFLLIYPSSITPLAIPFQPTQLRFNYRDTGPTTALRVSAYHAPLPPSSPPVLCLDLAGAALPGRIARATSGCLAGRVRMGLEVFPCSTISGSLT